MALTLVFMAILFLVAFHGRRRLALSVPYSSPHRCLFLGDFGPYAKQAVILVWFTSPVNPPFSKLRRRTRLPTPPGKWLRLDRAISLLWFLAVACRTHWRSTDSLSRCVHLSSIFFPLRGKSTSLLIDSTFLYRASCIYLRKDNFFRQKWLISIACEENVTKWLQIILNKERWHKLNISNS